MALRLQSLRSKQKKVEVKVLSPLFFCAAIWLATELALYICSVFAEDIMTMTCWKKRQAEQNNVHEARRVQSPGSLWCLEAFQISSTTKSNIMQFFRSIGCADQPRLKTIPTLRLFTICSMSYFVDSSPVSHFRILCVTGCCLEPTASSSPRATVHEKLMSSDSHDWCCTNQPLFCAGHLEAAVKLITTEGVFTTFPLRMS